MQVFKDNIDPLVNALCDRMDEVTPLGRQEGLD